MLQAMDELTALYDQLVDEDMTDYQKVKAIYEGVMARTDYNNTVFHKYQGSSDWDAMLSDPEFVLSQTWLGVVKGADVVCGGYSQAVSSLLDLAGIPNFVVTSYSSDMSHAWNKVLLDGKWYNLDATWGDGGEFLPVLPAQRPGLPPGRPPGLRLGRHLRGRAALPRPAGLPLRQKTRWSNPARFFSFAIPGSAGGPSPFSSGTTRS